MYLVSEIKPFKGLIKNYFFENISRTSKSMYSGFGTSKDDYLIIFSIVNNQGMPFTFVPLTQ